MQLNELESVFGWRVTVTDDTRPTTLRNWPMQSNGSELLRLACGLACEWGVRLIAPVHDALMLETPIDHLDQAIWVTRQAMNQASRAVLRGFTLGTDVEIIRYPDRYSDERGTVMWHRILEILDGIEAELPHGWEVDMGLAQQKHSIGERNYQ